MKKVVDAGNGSRKRDFLSPWVLDLPSELSAGVIFRFWSRKQQLSTEGRERLQNITMGICTVIGIADRKK